MMVQIVKSKEASLTGGMATRSLIRTRQMKTLWRVNSLKRNSKKKIMLAIKSICTAIRG